MPIAAHQPVLHAPRGFGRLIGQALGLPVKLFFASVLLTSSLVHAQKNYPQWGKDVDGSKDHPAIQRLTGSWLIGYRHSEWDAALFPGSDVVVDNRFKETATVEGKLTRLTYLAPMGKSTLEVFRNYEQALNAAGFKRKISCERDCTKLYRAWGNQLKAEEGMAWFGGGSSYLYVGESRYSMANPAAEAEGRMLYGTLSKGAQDVHVLLYTSVAKYADTGIAVTYLQIGEPKAMQTGQVTVDMKALQTGLTDNGKVALYGLFFDTAKAEIKPESKAQLDEMAALLRAQPALKVMLVGHTDNAGSFDANQSLSLQRAQALVSALGSAPYGIDVKRMVAKGVANMAPVASNATEAGRARNRRVEMVLQ